MNFLFASIAKDMKRWRADPLGFVILLGIPLLIGGLVTMMMSGGTQPKGVLLIADEDDTFVSGLFLQAFQQDGLSDMLTVEEVPLADGMTRINKGEGSALLIIPEGFTSAVLNLEPVALTLRKNPSQSILPEIIQDTAEILTDAGFYLQAAFGDDLKLISQWVDGTSEPSPLVIAAFSTKIQERLETVSGYMDPVALEVSVEEPPQKEPSPPWALLFLPGIMLMTTLFGMQTRSGDIWIERNQGVLRRVSASPSSVFGFMLAKIISAGIFAMLLAAIVVVLGFLYHGVSWDRAPMTLAWIGLGGMGLFAWFSVLQMAVPTQQAAGIFTLILVFPMMMTGGSFFPMAMMPSWMVTMGQMTPNGFMVAELVKEIVTDGPFAIEPRSWGILAAFTASGFVIAALQLVAGFARR